MGRRLGGNGCWGGFEARQSTWDKRLLVIPLGSGALCIIHYLQEGCTALLDTLGTLLKLENQGRSTKVYFLQAALCQVGCALYEGWVVRRGNRPLVRDWWS